MPNIKVTKALQKRSDQALESFHRYYASIWTEQRWHDTLFPALCQPTRYCALLNQYINSEDVTKALQAPQGSSEILSDFVLPRLGSIADSTSPKITTDSSVATQNSGESPFPAPALIERSEARKLLSHWNMDGASILAAHMLQVQPGDRVLDLCAAPGGKSLVLAQALWPSLHATEISSPSSDLQSVGSFLHSNEFDSSRNKRLASNLQSYLPAELIAMNAIQIVRVDGTEKSAAEELPFGQGGYDKVLLDAPCSSERHIIHAYVKTTSSGHIAEEMTNWKASHSKTLARTQTALLVTALRAVKIGGTVVYATCSLSREENDDVIERIVETVKRERKRNSESPRHAWKLKFDARFEDDDSARAILDNMTEKTKYGRIALPDHVSGGKWGPLYFCILQKIACKNKGGEP